MFAWGSHSMYFLDFSLLASSRLVQSAEMAFARLKASSQFYTNGLFLYYMGQYAFCNLTLTPLLFFNIKLLGLPFTRKI